MDLSAQVYTSVHGLCECEALATHRYTYWSSFFLDAEDVRSLSAVCNYIKRTTLPWLGHRFKGQKGPDESLRASGP